MIMPLPSFARLLTWTIFRRLSREWGRALLLVGGIALGVSMFLAIHFAADASVAAFRQSSALLGGQLEIRARRGLLKEEELRSIYPWVAKSALSAVFLEATAEVDSAPGSLPSATLLTITGIDPTEHSELTALGGDSLSDELPIAWVGSRFDLQNLGRLCVVVAERKSCLMLRRVPEEIESSVFLGRNALIMELRTLQEISGREGFVSGVLLKEPAHIAAAARPLWREELGRLVSELAADVPSGGGLVLEGDAERESRADKLLGAFRMNVLVMVLMTLLVCAFTVYNASQLSVRALLPDLSTLHTLGLSRPWMIAAVFLEAVVLGSLGALLGLTLGHPISQLTANVFLATAQTLYHVPAVSETLSFVSAPWLYVSSFLVGLGISVVGAVVPASKVRRVVPGIGVRAVQQAAPLDMRLLLLLACGSTLMGLLCVVLGLFSSSAIAAHGASFAIVVSVIFLAAPVLLGAARAAKSWLLPVIGPHAGLQVLLGVSGALGNIRASSVAVATTGCGLALLLGLGIMVESFRSSLGVWVEDSIAADFFISQDPGAKSRGVMLSEDYLQKVSKLPGVAEVLRTAALQGSVCREPSDCRDISVFGSEVRVAPDRRRYRLVKGDLKLADFEAGQSALISESAESRYGMRVGQLVSVALPGNEDFSVVVSGVYKDFSSEQGNILVDFSLLQKRSGRHGAESAAVYLTASASKEGVFSNLQALSLSDDGARVQDQGELRAAVFEIFDATFRVTDVLKITVILVCALGFAVTLAQLASERGREFRTIKMLGASERSLMGGVFFEGLLLALPSVLLGSFGGLLLALLLVCVINPLSFGWSLLFVVSPRTLALPIVALLGAYLIPLGWFVTRQVALISRASLSEE